MEHADAGAAVLAALRANTVALTELKDEVKRLADAFGKIAAVDPPKRGPQIDLGDVVGLGLEHLLGKKGKKR